MDCLMSSRFPVIGGVRKSWIITWQWVLCLVLGNELLNLWLVLFNAVIIRGRKKVVQLLLSMCCVHGDVGKTKKTY